MKFLKECSKIIVESLSGINVLLISCFTKLVFPTPESPSITNLKQNSGLISGFISETSKFFILIILSINKKNIKYFFKNIFFYYNY